MREFLILLGAFVILAGSWGASGAAAAGEFVPTGPMNTERYGATTTLLPNGKVLVAGGIGPGGDFLRTAELYDPATGQFTFTANGDVGGGMNYERYGAQAVLLDDGKVLIIGGYWGQEFGVLVAVETAEIYNPATGSFTDTAPMGVARGDFTATKLSNGTVMVTGGVSRSDALPFDSVELYTPGNQDWRELAGPIIEARSGALAFRMPGDKVFITGGRNDPVSVTTTSEIYDAGGETSAATGFLASGRTSAAGAELPGGKYLVAGGIDNTGFATMTSEIYNSGTELFGSTGSLSTGRAFAPYVTLGNGKVLIAGGIDTSEFPLDSAELFDPATGTFSATGALDEARWITSATRLNNGRVLIAGGAGGDNAPLASAELYHPDGVPLDLRVTKAGSGTGSVTSSPAGINCGNDCTGTYVRGSTVTLTASPGGDSLFSGWSGACSGKGTCQVTMSEARSVTATFEVKPPPGKLGKLTITRKARVKAGKKVRVKVTVRNVGGMSLTAKVTLKSSNKQVKVPKSVSIKAAPGKSASKFVSVKAAKKAKGKATITAKVGRRTARSKVTVQKAR